MTSNFNLVTDEINDACFSCKCDVDTSSVEAFFYRLGLPMYYSTTLDNNKTNNNSTTNNPNNQIPIMTMQQLYEMNDRPFDELETSLALTNPVHLKAVRNALNYAKSLFN